MLVSALPLTDQIGFAMTLGLLAWGLLRRRKLAAQITAG
jgi:uncharacterized protein (TIGR03382 family)